MPAASAAALDAHRKLPGDTVATQVGTAFGTVVLSFFASLHAS